MFRASYAKTMNMKKISTIFAICWLVLLFLYVLNTLVLFYLLSIARLISRSYETISTHHRVPYIEEKPLKQVWESPEPTWSITCDSAHFEYDLCYLNRPTVVDPTTATISSVDPTNSTPPSVIKIRPYPRKGQPEAMQRTKELTLTTAPLNTSCAIAHSTPALIFSAGGFTGNVFHDFNEGWVPLFVTIDEHFEDHDVVLGIVNCSDWWLTKYAELFSHFTRHPIVNLDKEKDHPLLPISDRHAGHETHILPTYSLNARPKLAFVGRKDTRKLVNEDEVRQAAEEVGFDVALFEVTPKTPMRDLFRLIDSSHVMAGVHGAGLTHELFLRPGSVLVQIVPINCGWLADMCLWEARNSARVLEPHDPASTIMGNLTNWYRYMNQDVKLDVVRFKRYLKRAYEKAKVLMHKQRLYAQIAWLACARLQSDGASLDLVGLQERLHFRGFNPMERLLASSSGPMEVLRLAFPCLI
ncbi:hypothetical protein Acr_06g0004310 [Actinidia rufa]|uniref:Glycosyltransferase 61 catalytic domain-containing protein n=1 Tax=Actinidia rufa TaxID=165716 RepID=A0A7J0EPT5_9ERIC|nr:hypothetical protein Acr_06g0004310 [Actinidia rufa]